MLGCEECFRARPEQRTNREGECDGEESTEEGFEEDSQETDDGEVIPPESSFSRKRLDPIEAFLF
jgi:hypothetical protein